MQTFLSSHFLSHVNLARHGGGDEGGAVVLELLDTFLDFGDKGVELGGLAVDMPSNCLLLV